MKYAIVPVMMILLVMFAPFLYEAVDVVDSLLLVLAYPKAIELFTW